MDKNNIIKLLERLKFLKNNNLYSKKYNDKVLEIDMINEYIAYREFGIKVGDKTTSNFSNDENFVVLECVDRLLNKGYEKEHIELEPKWKLGRGKSGGKADILVKDKNNKPLLIIECKTYGKEYKKEILNMKNDGGQLFSYFAQERDTKYLCLYASRVNKDNVEYENKIIQTSKEYEKAKNNIELFEIWKIKYLLSFNDNGIFEEDIQAYNIELQAKKRKDLKQLPEDNKIYNQFMEILRHHNISETERAFNKIISLFLCKIVDETKPSDQELDFQYKNGIDDIYTMQDKLLNLFHIGMKDYLKEEVTYIKESEIVDSFKFYSNKTALNEILLKFREQKYHSNNEFTFLDVNSKELFYKNAEVLKEVVELFQDYQFSYTHKEQILGNFFENLLSKGFKQREGQFFTPVPITKFIMMSLPINNIIKQKQKNRETYPLPYIIDYACGSAHFLTEAIDEVSTEIEELELKEYDDTLWVKRHIYGVEKDYRLSRTAKVACFLNGAGESNIIYGDGLEYRKELPEGRFDIVVANPPYSVKDFKNFTEANSNNYKLFDSLTNHSSEIEVLFLEKTSQLLNIGGYGAIILPSSILTNGGIYSKARKLLLEDFYIKAITEFGSNTFGATGTNTVTLFLEKRQLRDNIYFSESVKLQFQNKKKLQNDHYTDDNYLNEFCEMIGVKYEDYKTIFTDTLSDNLKDSEFYQNYKKWFNSLTEIKNLQKRNKFKNLSKEEEKQELDKKLLFKIKANEEEKFRYFCLCLESNQKTTIIKTGEKQAEKDFLGYEWSKRKGSEGIKIYEDTKLYDENNKTNRLKANSYIRSAFFNQDLEIDESLENNIFKYNLVDLIDFKKIDFDCAIGLSIKKDMEIKSRWELKTIGELCELKAGGDKPKNIYDISTKEHNIPIYANGTKNKGLFGFTNIIKIKEACVTISARGTIGYAIARNEAFYPIVRLLIALPKDYNILNVNYLEIIINKLNIKGNGAGVPQLTVPTISEYKIPLPPLDIQEKIVEEIETIEKQNQILKDVNSRLKNEIEDIIKSVDGEMVKLEDIAVIQSGGTPKTTISEYWNGDINWLKSEVCQNCLIYENKVKNKITELGLKKSSTKVFKKDTILIALVGATIGKVGYLTFKATTNQNIAGLYPKDNQQLLSKYLYFQAMNLYPQFTSMGSGKFKMANLRFVRNLKIPLPSLEEQKETIEKIEKLETKINQNNSILENEKKQKDEILKSYL